MTGNRRPWRRLYFFEIFTVVNFAVMALIVAPGSLYALTSIAVTFISFVPMLAGYAVAGLIVRMAVAYFRGGLAAYVRVVRSRGWLLDTARLLVQGGLLLHTYAWIKLVVPLLHPGLFDQELWDLDQAMFFGYSPNILLVNVFSHPVALHVIDWSYARIFFTSLAIAFGFFLSSPSRRLRVAFADGNSMLWLIGAWLYLLLPSIGPALRFPELWLPLASSLELSTHVQATLMKNYQAVLRLQHGGSLGAIQLIFGVAAFPSLHVGFQTFAFLWMRRVWIYGEVVFGVFTLFVLIGSVVTGWHYLIDGLAAMIMAAFCYDCAARIGHIRRWRRLRARQALVSIRA